MAQYTVELGELGFTVDADAGAPPVAKVELHFHAHTFDELSSYVDVLGFDVEKMDPTTRLQTRYGLKLVHNGEPVGTATVYLWLRDGLAADAPDKPPLAAMVKLQEAHRARV